MSDPTDYSDNHLSTWINNKFVYIREIRGNDKGAWGGVVFRGRRKSAYCLEDARKASYYLEVRGERLKAGG